MIPTLYTDRLTLRPYQRSDFDAYAAFMGSTRAEHMNGPMDGEEAWNWFTNDIATWALYGFGPLAIAVDGKLAGGVGLVHPPHFPEAECGWFIFDGYTGQGYAAEAGRAMLQYTFATTQLASIVSYIGESNAASIRVAEKLGASRDDTAKAHNDERTIVYRHTRNTLHRSVT